jgi:hypothetical protein
MFYSTGHETNHSDGYAYDFEPGPEYLHDMPAQRAVLQKFQSYPRNLVQGAGQLVMGQPGWLPGSHFAEWQPPQVIQNWNEIPADLFGGGIDANGFTFQPLVSGSGD